MKYIGIIIPVHNDSQYLERCLASCLNQDALLSIVVVNDCSTLEHQECINAIFDKYMKIKGVYFIRVCNEINYGLAGARNKGIEERNFTYILPLDVDDYLYPNVLGKMLIEIEKGFDIVYGNITDGTEEKKIIARPETANITTFSFIKENPLFCTSLYTKEIWKRAGGYPMFPFSHYEDYAFWCKCQSVGAKFKYINELIYHHTNREGSMLNELHYKTNDYKELARKGLEYNNDKNCFRLI